MQTVQTISLKANQEDVTLVKKIMEKLGIGPTAVLRMAIRTLARNQKVTLN